MTPPSFLAVTPLARVEPDLAEYPNRPPRQGDHWEHGLMGPPDELLDLVDDQDRVIGQA